MKIFAILLLLMTHGLLAKTIVISSFDPFDGAPANNSEVIGTQVVQQLKSRGIKVKHCKLRTVYFKGFETLKDCIAELDEAPELVVSLGEGHCDGIRLETRAKNIMNDVTHDNDGVSFKNEPILVGGEQFLPMSVNYHTPYCQLTNKEKRFITISKSAGTFVCNNTAYLMSNEYSQMKYTFIHVPRHNCLGKKRKIQKSINLLTKIIPELAQTSTARYENPVNKKQINQRIKNTNNQCEKAFLKKLRSAYQVNSSNTNSGWDDMSFGMAI